MNFEQMRAHRRENRFQAVILIVGMALVMSLVGYTLGGRTGVWLALVFSGASVLVSPAISPRMILQMYKARPIEPPQAPDLYELFRELVRRAELAHVPTLHYVPSKVLNAFAVGADRNAAVAVTDGLLRTLSPRELAGVLAHELSHLRFRDTHLMALGDVFSRMTATMSQIGQFLLLLSLPLVLMGHAFIPLGGMLLLIGAPIASTLLQLALSRSREFNADLGAIELTADPAGLASALEKLERAQSGSFLRRIFMPYRVQEPTVLRTHPGTEERIERLRRMAGDVESGAFPVVSAAHGTVPIPMGPRRIFPAAFDRIRARPRWHPSGLWY